MKKRREEEKAYASMQKKEFRHDMEECKFCEIEETENLRSMLPIRALPKTKTMKFWNLDMWVSSK